MSNSATLQHACICIQKTHATTKHHEVSHIGFGWNWVVFGGMRSVVNTPAAFNTLHNTSTCVHPTRRFLLLSMVFSLSRSRVLQAHVHCRRCISTQWCPQPSKLPLNHTCCYAQCHRNAHRNAPCVVRLVAATQPRLSSPPPHLGLVHPSILGIIPGMIPDMIPGMILVFNQRWWGQMRQPQRVRGPLQQGQGP